MVEISAAQVGVGILFQSFPPLAMFGHCATHPAFKYFYTSNLCFPSFSGGGGSRGGSVLFTTGNFQHSILDWKRAAAALRSVTDDWAAANAAIDRERSPSLVPFLFRRHCWSMGHFIYLSSSKKVITTSTNMHGLATRGEYRLGCEMVRNARSRNLIFF